MAKKSTVLGSVYQVRDLTAGVNLRPSATNIKPNQARRLLNAYIGNAGELGMYPGFTGWMNSFASDRIQGAKRIYLADLVFTVFAHAGKIVVPTDGGVYLGSPVYTGLNAINEIDFVHDRNIVAAFDGEHSPVRSVDGSNWVQLGITPPALAPTLTAVNNGGTLPDTHTISVSYDYYNVNLLSSNESPAGTVAMAAPNLTARVGVIASTDPQVTGIKVYAMDVTAGETVRRLTATLANTTANHDITINNWDAQEEAPTDRNVPEPMSFGVVWKNRWWGRDAVIRNRLRFSQIFQPTYWPSTYYVDIPFQRGEDLTAVYPVGDTLICFGYSHFLIINGQTALDFEVRPAIGAQTGALGFRAVDAVEGGVVHAGAPGIYVFNGSSDELISYPIEPAWHDFIENGSPIELARLPLIYHKPFKELRIGVNRLYPTGGYGEWIMDLNRGRGSDTGPAWFSTSRYIGGYYQYDGEEGSAGDAGRLFSWDPTANTYILEERTGVSAAGGGFRDMQYDGYIIPFGFQVARVIETYMEYQDADGVLIVDLKIDGLLMGAQAFTLGGDLSRYGSAVYHVSTYSNNTERKVRPFMWPSNAEGRTAQLLVRFQGQGDFKLYTYGHNAVLEPLPRGF